MYIYSFDPQKVLERCQLIPTEEYQVECYTYAVYVTVMTPFYKGDLGLLCKPMIGDRENYMYCLAEEMEGLADNKKNHDVAVGLCERQPDEYKGYCNYVRGVKFTAKQKSQFF